MRHNKAKRHVILIVFAFLAPTLFASMVPKAHAAPTYTLGTIPFLGQEGTTFTIVLQVGGATGGTQYQFRFWVKDPAANLHSSTLQNYTTASGQTQFTLPVFFYPTSSFPGPNNLVGQYFLNATQLLPAVVNPNVAQTYFLIFLTDNYQYQRTETVKVQATAYHPGEPASVKIATASTPPTTVFAINTTASLSGVVTASWHIPPNAVLDPKGYIATVTGAITVKTPADVSGFNVNPASMSIAALNSLKSIYQRTETMSFSFQPVYPDGTIASTGVALLTLTRPGGGSVILTTAYSGASQTFNATYKTSVTNVTGSWTASLAANAYSDAWGNSGPTTKLTNTPLMVPATLTINIVATTYVPIGQLVKLNATVSYPDGTTLTTGTGVKSYLIYTGTSGVTHNVPLTFDTGFQHWFGSYTPQTSDPGGLWSLIVNATDSPTPPNTGSASTAVTLQDRPPVASFTSTPSSAPTGTAITFDGTASYDPDGAVVSYSWAFGDGATGTGPVVTHSYTPAKTYTVTLTVTDNGGATGSTTSQVTITDRPPVASFTPSPTTANTGQTVTLTISSSDPDGTISTTRVDWGDTITQLYSGAITSATHSYSSTGSSTSKIFTIIVTATDNNASYTSTSSQVTINDRVPVPSFNPSSTTLSTGQNITLTISATDPDGTVTTLRVDWGDGNIDTLSGTATSDIHSYSSTGTSTSKIFMITVNATDNSGSTGISSSQITVSDRPPVVTFTSSPASVSTGQTVAVTITASDPDGTIISTKVDWGDGTADTLGGQTKDSHQYASTGGASSKTFAITVTVIDNSGSSTPSYSSVNVQASSQPSGNVSLPLYYFAILAAVVAVLLVGGFLAFRRHKVTHAKLKIDLEAVRSEAGRIENQEFFQSVKDQLKKDKDA
ncbi:MAG TPA: PKD domain-containing protein [Candidatus Angelobacter sp.]|nr:PKD domain-containing protein [Candidatus Angelobacter sp.]